MTVFAAIAPERNSKLEPAVTAKFEAGSYYKITPDQFLIYSPTLTTQQLSDTLGAKGGGVGLVLVVRFTGYAGWHSKDLWEWLESHTSPPPAPPEKPVE
jgi:hypothetical protein